MTQSSKTGAANLPDPPQPEIPRPHPDFCAEIAQLVLDAGGVDEAEAQALLVILSRLEQVAEREGSGRAFDMAAQIRAIWLREPDLSVRADLVEARLDGRLARPSRRARRAMAH